MAANSALRRLRRHGTFEHRDLDIMRTTRSTITFQRAFTLNATAGELPPGSYEIETDEEEIPATRRTAFHRVATYLYVETSASTRTIIVSAADLEAALERDASAIA